MPRRISFFYNLDVCQLHTRFIPVSLFWIMALYIFGYIGGSVYPLYTKDTVLVIVYKLVSSRRDESDGIDEPRSAFDELNHMNSFTNEFAIINYP